jgi:hypothetical protein
MYTICVYNMYILLVGKYLGDQIGRMADYLLFQFFFIINKVAKIFGLLFPTVKVVH